MPYLFAPDGGVNRKLKVLYVPNGGINCKQKSLWALDQGVNRKIFSSGIAATYAGIKAWSSNNNYDYGGTRTSYTDSSNIDFYGTVGLNDGSAASHSLRVSTWFTLPIDPSQLANGAQLLSFNGNFTVSNTVMTLTEIAISFFAGNNYTGASYSMGGGSLSLSLANGTYSNNFTATYTSSNTYSGYSVVTMVVSFYVTTTSYGDATGRLTFPWSNLTWLPTGDKIQLAA